MNKIDMNENSLRQLFADDIQNHLIAKEFGCSESCIERRAKKLGLTKNRTGPKSGHRHPDWKGGRCIVKGYWYIYSPDHPNRTKKNYVSEHRLVMEQKLGRYLHLKEVVHHKDGDPQNNDPENLEVFRNNSLHLKHELTGRTPNWTEDGKKKMRAAVLLSAQRRRIQK